jgi:predicted CXXCH cytochrome family protein
MKKLILVAAAVLATALAANATIVNSKHDLSVGAGGESAQSAIGSTLTEICIYCHTPHNPARTTPLWNRIGATSPGAFTFYNSATATAATKGASFSADSVSLFCMSCHDGVTGMGSVKNTPVAATAGADAVNAVALVGSQTITSAYANIGNSGGNLTNDHPVGFSYASAVAQDNGGLNGATAAHDNLVGASGTAIFFGTGADQMECASCHAVHEPGTSRNFLRKENTRSALCLGCHNK